MALHLDPGEHEPHRDERIERLPGAEDRRELSRTWQVAGGTLACPECDVPVMPAVAVSLTESLGCPYCRHEAAARNFLTVTDDPRPARVRVMATIVPSFS
jgi:hypothetical protein